MASQSNLYAGIAGYVGRADQKGLVGVFRRPAGADKWDHVLPDLETYTVNVHPTDNDQEHMQAHMQVMQMSGDPHGTVRKHLMEHQAQLAGKAADAQKQAQGGGQPGAPGGGGNDGGGRPPESGAQPGTPSNMRMPPGAIPQDQMARAGAVTAPRK